MCTPCTAYPSVKPNYVLQSVIGDHPGDLLSKRAAAGDDDAQFWHLVAQEASGLDDRVLPVPVFECAMTDCDKPGFAFRRGGQLVPEHRPWICTIQHDGNAVWRGAPLNVPLFKLVGHRHRVVGESEGPLLNERQDAGEAA